MTGNTATKRYGDFDTIEDLAQNLDPLVSQVIHIIASAEGPVGARRIREELGKNDVEPSESTTARRLRQLDTQGITRQMGAKGRVLTSLGFEVATHLTRASDSRLARAMNVRDAVSLRHLLETRLAIEPAAASDVARFASKQSIQNLQRAALNSDHAQNTVTRDTSALPSVEFHWHLADTVTNPILQAIYHSVLNSNLHYVDSTMDAIIGQDASEQISHNVIVEKISERDAAAAADLMQKHVQFLIDELDKFIAKNGEHLVAHLLQNAWSSTTGTDWARS